MRPSGHQVTPRLRALFHAGVSCDSSPSRASHVGESCDSSPSRASRVGESCDSSPSHASRAGASDPIAFARFVNYKNMSSTHKAPPMLSCEL